MESGIIVIGSLNPEKDCQDRVRVFDRGGVLSGVKGNRPQRSTKDIEVIYEQRNKS